MSSNRDRVLTAAIALLADEGVRSLTHLRVDERAGLARGSTSNIYRSREALLVGVARHMATTELPLVAASLLVDSVEELIESLVVLFDSLTRAHRKMTAARLALFVEAGHEPQVRAALAEGRARFDDVTRPAFRALGAAQPDRAAQLLAVCFEGLFLHHFGGHAVIEPRPIIAAAVRAGLEVS